LLTWPFFDVTEMLSLLGMVISKPTRICAITFSEIMSFVWHSEHLEKVTALQRLRLP